MDGASEQSLSMLTDLREAVEQNQLQLYLQPKLDIGSGRIIGAEALIRWRHPESGLTPPATFIPFAEESGLIVPIGLWVLREACLQAMRWKRKGLPQMPVAVNISAAQFHAKNFVADVAAILAETGISPRMLELELTETTIMQEVGATIEALRDLRAMGINVSIDDFGTGYSGLSYLKHFPVDTLKIDRSFVMNMERDRADVMIVRSTIDQADQADLPVPAGGRGGHRVARHRRRTVEVAGQTVTVENRPAPAATSAAPRRARAAPDGTRCS
jgi:EAL domain-containing protein (putative c-di-GMP-specific phosphodiesterase class I)